MMIFSDLDRSIIYSNKFLQKYRYKDNDYECIETYDGREISYISKKTIKLIQEIQKIGMFIPTTTRTEEQFRRINFSKYNIDFPYVIASNGATILKNNQPLKEWEDIIEYKKKNSENIEFMMETFETEVKAKGIPRIRSVENLFFYLVVDESVFNIQDIKKYIDKLDYRNWMYYISGRKIYFLPRGITKENAIEYILDKINIKEFIAIGDSTMDLGMLNKAPISYALKHGNVVDSKINNNCIITKAYGMEGTEEILLNIIEMSSSVNI